MSDWEIEVGPGGVDTRRDRRAHRYDLADVDEALRLIKRQDKRPGVVTLIHEDGYRERLRV